MSFSTCIARISLRKGSWNRQRPSKWANHVKFAKKVSKSHRSAITKLRIKKSINSTSNVHLILLALLVSAFNLQRITLKAGYRQNESTKVLMPRWSVSHAHTFNNRCKVDQQLCMSVLQLAYIQQLTACSHHQNRSQPIILTTCFDWWNSWAYTWQC